MSKKRRGPASPVPSPRVPTTGSPQPQARPGRRLTGWRGTVARLAIAVFVPLFFMAALELTLRLTGYGYSTRFFQKAEDGRTFTTNRRFGWQFMPRESATQPYPVSMTLEKPKGTRRIFILGESAAQGTPAPAFGFARLLEVMLQQQFPEQRFEIVNAAMRGINSHAIRLIARECASFDPDLFILYLGNNEAVGFYAPEPGPFNLTAHPRLIRLVQWLKGTKLAQLFTNTARALRKAPPKREKQEMDFFRARSLEADAPLRQAVVANFRENLGDILEVTRRSGAPVVLSTVAVNLLDFPPLASRHRAGLSEDERQRWEAAYKEGTEAETAGDFPKAIALFQKALQIDSHYAELQFRLARCYLATGEAQKAREHFSLARDWDALAFRSDSRINTAIREAAARKDPGLKFVDAEQTFSLAATNEHQIPGNRFFYEHVHLTFDGDYLLAQTLFPAVVAALGLPAGAGPTNAARPLPSREECARVLGFSPWDELGTKAAMVRQTANPPFLDQLEHGTRQARAEGEINARTRAFTDPALQQQSIEFSHAALRLRPDDWQNHLSLANLLTDLGQFAAAAEEFAWVVKAQPDFLSARLLYGNALRRAGRTAEAIAQFEEVLRREPGQPNAQAAIADTLRSSRGGR